MVAKRFQCLNSWKHHFGWKTPYSHVFVERTTCPFTVSDLEKAGLGSHTVGDFSWHGCGAENEVSTVWATCYPLEGETVTVSFTPNRALQTREERAAACI